MIDDWALRFLPLGKWNATTSTGVRLVMKSMSYASIWQTHSYLLPLIFAGWWFGTFFIFHTLGILIPTDYIICFRGVGLNHQAVCVFDSTAAEAARPLRLGLIQLLKPLYSYKNHSASSRDR